MPDYYQILNINQNASQENIKKAYIALAKRYHPDTTELDITVASRLMTEINQAYEILGNIEKRRLYDASISSGSTGNIYANPDNSQAYALANTVLQKQIADYLTRLDAVTSKEEADSLQHEFKQAAEYTYNRLLETNSCDPQTAASYAACQAKFIKIKAYYNANLTDDGKYVKKELYIPVALYNTLADKGIDIDEVIKAAIKAKLESL